MLIDDVVITVKAGNGGDGASAFLHISGNYKGGPSGGNGGNGGNLFVQGTDDLTALQQFQFKKLWKAEDGIAGQHKNLYGRNGKDLIILVPIGTHIENTKNKKSFEVRDNFTQVLLAKGGTGGRGNNSFKSATNQAPKYAEEGTSGEEKELHLQLRIIADIGLIGLPNAGKSSLLAALTNAQPKIANYPFTTLEPNLGVMSDDVSISKPLVLADIPGIIAGASSGKGLGFQFLKHIEKTKVLVHCLDVTDEQILQTYQTVRKEFESYSQRLIDKNEIILLTKTDLVQDDSIEARKKDLSKLQKKIYTVSIYNKDSLETLREILRNLNKNDSSEEIAEIPSFQ